MFNTMFCCGNMLQVFEGNAKNFPRIVLHVMSNITFGGSCISLLFQLENTKNATNLFPICPLSCTFGIPLTKHTFLPPPHPHPQPLFSWVPTLPSPSNPPPLFLALSMHT